MKLTAQKKTKNVVNIRVALICMLFEAVNIKTHFKDVYVKGLFFLDHITLSSHISSHVIWGGGGV